MVYVKRMKRYIKKMNYCTNRYSQVKEFTKELTSVRHAQSRLELPVKKDGERTRALLERFVDFFRFEYKSSRLNIQPKRLQFIYIARIG